MQSWTSDELTLALIDAIPDLPAFSPPQPAWDGFVLGTDSGLSNLVAAAAPQGWMRGRDEPLWWGDWPIEVDGPAFDVPGAILTTRYERQERGWEQHVRESFECYVLAMARLRVDGLFRDETLLMVSASDPGGELLTMARDSIRRLNGPELLARWDGAWGLADVEPL